MLNMSEMIEMGMISPRESDCIVWLDARAEIRILARGGKSGGAGFVGDIKLGADLENVKNVGKREIFLREATSEVLSGR